MSEQVMTLTPAVAIIGAGPAGLSAARELATQVPGQVLVIDREGTPGGIPRHSDHPGYGVRDLGRFMSGPAYARRLTRRAEEAGATILTNATVTHWSGERSFDMTTPQGRIRVEAQAVILATGARERPRAARMVPGDRTHGIYTTGQLQNRVHLKHRKVGNRAVIVGAEMVSWSAALTLQHVKCRTAVMVTSYPRPDVYWFVALAGKLFFRTQVATRSKVTAIIGKPQVTGVEIEDLVSGKRSIVPCDTVVFTGDWIPDNELARSAGIIIDPQSKSPLTDATLATDIPGVFAIGNLLHPVDTADIAALDGRHVVPAVLSWLRGPQTGGTPPPRNRSQLTVHSPLRWVSPSYVRVAETTPARRQLRFWTTKYVPFPRVIARQNGKVIGSKRVLWPATPGRVFRVPSSLLDGIDSSGAPITIELDR